MRDEKPLTPHGFGVLVVVALQDLVEDAALRAELRHAWHAFGGLLAIRGLEGITARQLVDVCASLGGPVETDLDASKSRFQVEPGVMRIGNLRDAEGNLISMCVDSMSLDGSPRWQPERRAPAWHTDSVYRQNPPVGSALFCRQAPPEGAETCFCDTAAGYAALRADARRRLDGLECLASLAHHDAKVRSTNPEYPVPTPDQRRANPPKRIPCVLRHPRTGRPAVYGVNSGTFAVVPKGTPIDATRLDAFELDGFEDPSVDAELRSLLPHLTADRFALVWRWQPGDLVLWDNRCTMHAATGFDMARYTREMWRLTIVADHPDDDLPPQL
ncbi:hypothetical protein CTAYLR_001562 [Chrysophaeum taylorii]|uniref:TauD/TfdA-like domain-containing protein n=1 Tax=Chrysophaeum taylorii TaxID=2483200 RepID=A0AAD7UE53_9STRA|nr:hypothetical protein CTAYLR_001562 [Chrysophaeum taylorii]